VPDSPARLRLAAATRQLTVAALSAETVPESELEAAATAAESALAALGDLGAPIRRRRDAESRYGDYLPRSPLVGSLNAMSPPLEFSMDDEGVHAWGTFGTPSEGPPGYVHGGWVALAFDEALGMANAAAGHSGMTARLTIRYRRPTPLHVPVRIDAHTERVEGRRIVTVGTQHVAGQLTAEAEGLFVSISDDRAREYFGDV
jgi:acyl-coenzyme A thioesterase PaaI-like protein